MMRNATGITCVDVHCKVDFANEQSQINTQVKKKNNNKILWVRNSPIGIYCKRKLETY